MAKITHRCDGTMYLNGPLDGEPCDGRRYSDGTVKGGCGEPCSWVCGKSGYGNPPWPTGKGNTRIDPGKSLVGQV